MSIAVGQARRIHAAESGQEGSEAFRLCGEEKRGTGVVPAGLSPTCTNEHACIVNEMKPFEALDAEVLGVSVDSVWSHKGTPTRWESSIASSGFSSARSDEREIWSVLADKGTRPRIAIVNKAGKVAWFKNYDIPVVPDLKEVRRRYRR